MNTLCQIRQPACFCSSPTAHYTSSARDLGTHLSCLSCISVARWLGFKNANVMLYVKALGFPVMPPTEEMDATQLINVETQNRGSTG